MSIRKKSPDFVLFLTVMSLLSLGVIMVLSASEYKTLIDYNDSFYFFKRQLIWAAMGIAAMLLALNYDYWRLKRYIGPALIIAFVLLVLVLIPGVGREVNGARRWIGVGPIPFAPAELVKLCIIVFTAYGLAREKERVKVFTRGVLPYLIVLALAAGLILLQPDLGTAMSLAGIVFVMIFAAGARMSHLGGIGLAGVAAIGFAIVLKPYRMQRFLAFLDPWADPQGAGFHIIQGLYAIGSGGLFGLGLGQSKQKFLYLPESHTDFIFAIIGEELGFIGAALVIMLFLLFIWRGIKIAVTSQDPFASLLATGITAWVGVQAIINIGVVTGSLPVTGIPLPFISSGGTSLLFTMIAVGILLNISRFTTTR
ncbi:stage V sporulation protein E [Pelotomaculum propionicicum]|uniref:Probable peptidoglycan glycosyltransferase FtsW n=1 Tax=Pelotomaculum propionicicum TaxID=258475 RepID=A0A4Y7RWI1_9FIRM|nr:stage V sporulation protein E [Pelotomaculum propionicicum]NLI11823.1 stage V sporulation protein E [Peptococcaceae bacterium]TEB13130.1 putative peptidoglycan glycosyltransferase FtsW [Pelotomaculum propionicicum]